ncbi:MAG: hypothetical protein N2037_13610 [Acidimicrobiales bacterium]|nr:hypothetical protein [Acidimicrobiales bacterium]
MTSSREALDRLIAACPSFLGATDLYEYMAWSEEEGEPDEYVRAAALAQHLVRLIERREVDELPGVFGIVEEILAEGDQEAVYLIRMGLLESLLNICSHDDVAVDAGDFELLLGAAAREEWRSLSALWERAGARRQVLPRFTESEYLNIKDPNLKLYFRTTKRKLADGTLVTAADVVRYENYVADSTWRAVRVRRASSQVVLLFGVLIVVAIALLLWRY